MGKPLVLLGIAPHPQALARLEEEAVVQPISHLAVGLSPDEALADGIITYVPRLTAQDLRQAGRLKVVSCHSCPTEMLALLESHGVQVTLVPSLWDTVADFTLGLIFAAARFIPQAHRAILGGEWPRADLKRRYSGTDVFGKTLGIIGLGRIGSILTRRVQGFDMRILYTDLERKADLERKYSLTFVSLDQLLQEADYVVLLAPLNEETRGMIGEEQLRLMKRNAVLVNSGRGALIDEAALVRALREGWIGAAGLDVFIEEPLPADHPFMNLENVVLAPHLGGSTRDCDLVLVEDTLRVLRGEPPRFPARGNC